MLRGVCFHLAVMSFNITELRCNRTSTELCKLVVDDL